MFVVPTPQVDFTINGSDCDTWIPTIVNVSQGDSLSFSWSVLAINSNSSLDSTY